MAVIYFQKEKGMSIVEILLVLGLVNVTFVALLSFINFSLKVAYEKKLEVVAYFEAQETMEGLRSFRDNSVWDANGLNTFTLGDFYHLEKSGSPLKWSVVPGEALDNGFTTRIIFSEVRRDINSNIVESGGAVDINSKKVTANVIWRERSNIRQLQLTGLLTNWK